MDKNKFTILKWINLVKITLADDFEVISNEEGEFRIDLVSEDRQGRTTFVLSKVLYNLDEGMNLFSCSPLDAESISRVIEDGVCKLSGRDNERDTIGYTSLRRSDSVYILRDYADIRTGTFLCASKKSEQG